MTSSIIDDFFAFNRLWTYIPLILAAFILIRRHGEQSRNPKGLPLPPGPIGYPIIGSMLSIPHENHWLVFKEWSKTYGDMTYVRSLGMNYLVLDSLERITDLFDKRSANYSDRGGLTMLIDLMNWSFNMAFIPYSAWWRKQKKVFTDHFNPVAIKKYDEVQMREIRAFLNRLLQEPDDFLHHIHHLFASIVIDIAYGIKIPPNSRNNPYVAPLRESFDGLALAGIPGMFMVDHLPFLKYLPAWTPGASFRRKADRGRRVIHEISGKTFDHVKASMEQGNERPSVAATLLSQIPPTLSRAAREEEELLAQYVAGVSYSAGADTTASSVSAFFLAMAMYPEAQKKAQAEIDTVVDSSRLPDFRDRPSMPYIEALMLELMRWHPVTPLALAHMSSADDEYDGYFIPKGTIVFGNAWSILNDPKIFHQPLKFNPDRYIENPNLRKPHVAFFGFGRRACPGQHFSDRNLFAVVTSVLAVFDILPPIGDDGIAVKLKYEATTGLVSYPSDFSCRIVPRSKAAMNLIIDSMENQS